MQVMHSQELAVALQATRLAAKLCQHVQKSVTTEALEKRDKSPVTIADFGSQAIIALALREAFPGIPLIAEEDSAALREDSNPHLRTRVVEEVARTLDRPDLGAEEVLGWIDHGGASEYSELFWTLDPIDGTKGFLRGEQYAIALALVREGEPICATLGCPNLPNSDGSAGAIFSAAEGTTTSHLVDGGSEAVRVSGEQSLAVSRFCESVESAHSDHSQSKAIAHLLGIAGKPVRMDSQAKYAAVARGDAEMYLRLPTRPGYVERIWDHAAGYAVLKGAGGTITDVDGKQLDFRHGRGLEKNRGVVASNGLHHAELIDAIAKTS
ncbi:MAG: 3'(2'),5'-bisphosphate nucleotidase [Myxococcales bacterium]|nr:3'(2'),5'-bisphosphate nucleotidase [Myxococcales bacterium]